MQYSTNIRRQLNKMVTEKQSIMQTLKRDKVPTYAGVIKGGFGYANNEEENLSNMSDSAKSTNNNMSTENTNNMTNNHVKSSNTSKSHSSQWSKESVMDKIQKLHDELKQEKQERQKERNEYLKEKEEQNNIIEGMKQFQDLIINMNNEDTDEEISMKVRKIARKVQR